mgnify:CR=1 FL=1
MPEKIVKSLYQGITESSYRIKSTSCVSMCLYLSREPSQIENYFDENLIDVLIAVLDSSDDPDLVSQVTLDLMNKMPPNKGLIRLSLERGLIETIADSLKPDSEREFKESMLPLLLEASRQGS